MLDTIKYFLIKPSFVGDTNNYCTFATDEGFFCHIVDFKNLLLVVMEM